MPASQVPGSRLYSLFGPDNHHDALSPHDSQGRWKNENSEVSPSILPLDAQGRPFLDVQPECFLPLLTSLRHVCLSNEAKSGPPTPVPLGPVRRDLEAYMHSLITHLGLQSLVFR